MLTKSNHSFAWMYIKKVVAAKLLDMKDIRGIRDMSISHKGIQIYLWEIEYAGFLFGNI